MFREEHTLFRAAVRSFVEKEITPHVEEWEEAGEIPRWVWLRMGELGFLGVEYSAEYGGAGADFPTTVVLCEELSRSRSCSLAMAVGVHTEMASPHLYYTGSEELKCRYLPAIIKGEKLCAIAGLLCRHFSGNPGELFLTATSPPGIRGGYSHSLIREDPRGFLREGCAHHRLLSWYRSGYGPPAGPARGQGCGELPSRREGRQGNPQGH